MLKEKFVIIQCLLCIIRHQHLPFRHAGGNVHRSITQKFGQNVCDDVISHEVDFGSPGPGVINWVIRSKERNTFWVLTSIAQLTKIYQNVCLHGISEKFEFKSPEVINLVTRSNKRNMLWAL